MVLIKSDFSRNGISLEMPYASMYSRSDRTETDVNVGIGIRSTTHTISFPHQKHHDTKWGNTFEEFFAIITDSNIPGIGALKLDQLDLLNAAIGAIYKPAIRTMSLSPKRNDTNGDCTFRDRNPNALVQLPHLSNKLLFIFGGGGTVPRPRNGRGAWCDGGSGKTGPRAKAPSGRKEEELFIWLDRRIWPFASFLPVDKEGMMACCRVGRWPGSRIARAN
jgi:hypothetical protein